MSESSSTSCPACGGRRFSSHQVQGVAVCRRCDAVFTTRAIYLGESLGIVSPFWEESNPPAEETRYFDLTSIGSRGIERRHGWYWPKTRRIVQVG